MILLATEKAIAEQNEAFALLQELIKANAWTIFLRMATPIGETAITKEHCVNIGWSHTAIRAWEMFHYLKVPPATLQDIFGVENHDYPTAKAKFGYERLSPTNLTEEIEMHAYKWQLVARLLGRRLHIVNWANSGMTAEKCGSCVITAEPRSTILQNFRNEYFELTIVSLEL